MVTLHDPVDSKATATTELLQYFVMHGIGLFIKLKNHVAHMFYAWLFSYNTTVPIAIKQKKYYLALYTYIIVFDWGYVN